MPNQCPTVKLIQQQQSETVKRISSSAPTSVNHSFAPKPVNQDSKTSFANVVKHTVQDQQLTKDGAFKGFRSNMYASCVCSTSAVICQNVPDHLLLKINLPIFFLGDFPPLSPIYISTTT